MINNRNNYVKMSRSIFSSDIFKSHLRSSTILEKKYVSFDFNGDKFRVCGGYNDNPSKFYDESNEKLLKIDVLCGVMSLYKLPSLMPNVEDLVLKFCNSYPYDLNELLSLKSLKSLTINSNFGMFKLKNLNSLKGLNLSSLTVFNFLLDASNPKMFWPPKKNLIYNHINKIKVNNQIISY
jgi:hypothetical protein